MKSERDMLAEELSALSVFGALLEDGVVADIYKLLTAKPGIESARAMGRLAHDLYHENDNLTDAVLDRALTDQNLFMVTLSSGRKASAHLRRRAEEELGLLERVSRLTPERLAVMTGLGCSLPGWDISEKDFIPLYYDRVKNIASFGYGVFCKSRAFILENGAIVPVHAPDPITLEGLPGYQQQRQEVYDNTLALVEGRPAANVLLYGDSGTGKSSTVKAVTNALCDRGLRLIEIKKNQLMELPRLLEQLPVNPLKFIIFIDDLSFVRDDDNYAALKAALEGSVAAKTENVVIYATSNRRHLVKESFSDREGDDIHVGDTIAEQTSLSDRFGLVVTFTRPDKEHYLEIVARLCEYNGITLDKDELEAMAERFALAHSGRSPRVARQFVDALLSQRDPKARN